MSYTVLARKYRPKKFSEVVGQQHVSESLLNSVRQHRLHHAYLLTGTRGVGKTTLARILAKSINCLNPQNGEPCGGCEVCVSIDSGSFVDLLEIDAASNTGVDNIREVLDNAQYVPSVAKYKVYLIDEVHMLSKSAFNAMLKTLEEPPAHALFILATTDPQKVPITVLSRTLQFVLKNLSAEEISGYLQEVLDKEAIAYEEKSLIPIAEAAAGSMRDALSLLDAAIALGAGQVSLANVERMLGLVDKKLFYELLIAVKKGEKEKVQSQLTFLKTRFFQVKNILDGWAVILRDLALSKSLDMNLHAEEDLFKELLGLLSEEEIQLYYEAIVQAKKNLSFAPDDYSALLMALLRIFSFRDYFPHNGENSVLPLNKKKDDKRLESFTHSDESNREVKKNSKNCSLKEISIESKAQTGPLLALWAFDEEKGELNDEAKTWLPVMEALTETLGPYSHYVQQLVFLAGDTEKVILALPAGDKKQVEKEAKERIKDFFTQRGQQLIWRDKPEGTLSYREIRAQLKQAALDYLRKSAYGQQLQQLFEGEWQEESLKFKWV